MKKQFVQAIFCAPSGKNGSYPSRLTDEVFSALADAGINRIFGIVADDQEETRIRTFEFCEKYNMKYFPTPHVAEDYWRVVPGKNGEKPFGDLTEQELAELDEQFLSEVEGYLKYPAFGGIFFCDEKGYMAFDGIAYAKKKFDEKFADYEFHTNFVSYCINDDIFWGGMGGTKPENLPFELEGDLQIVHENRFNFYDKFVSHLFELTEMEYISQDMYPFERFCPAVPSAVHIALFELNAYFNQKKKEHGSKYFNYMQVGQWIEGYKQMSFAEMALQMHVTAAYGSEGFSYFPGCYPLDYLGLENCKASKDGKCSLIDINGNQTIFYEWTKMLNNGFFKQIENDILSSELLGVASYGNYDNGFTEEEIKELPNNECIFRGELPDMLRYESDIAVQCDNGLMVSTFERDGKKRYYLVNLSTVYGNKATLELPEGRYVAYGMNEVKQSEHQIELEIEPGQGWYILEQ